MVWVPDGGKHSKICLLVSAEYTNVTDTRTNAQTSHDNIGRGYDIE